MTFIDIDVLFHPFIVFDNISTLFLVNVLVWKDGSVNVFSFNETTLFVLHRNLYSTIFDKLLISNKVIDIIDLQPLPYIGRKITLHGVENL